MPGNGHIFSNFNNLEDLEEKPSSGCDWPLSYDEWY